MAESPDGNGMTEMTGETFLVLSANPHRRAYVAGALRASGAVSVEVVSLQRAQAILRQLQFDGLAIDFVGLGKGVVEFLTNLRIHYPETRVFIVGPPGDGVIPESLRASISTDCAGGAHPCDAGGMLSDTLPHDGNADRATRISGCSGRASRNGKNGRQT